MEEDELISIVVPVYNVENYLKKCISSILEQTYKKFELILVDDGSTDDSGKICDEIKKMDNRIEVIHKKNGGLSDARNAGIDIARGKYITFIDSDDYIEIDYIEYLYNLIKMNNAMISVCAYYVITENGYKINSAKGYGSEVLNKIDAYKRMLNEEGFSVSAWAKMYLKSLFDDIRYPFGRLNEDNGTTYKLIDQVEKIAFGADPKYYYLKRTGSIMLSGFKLKKMDMIVLTDEMCDFLDNKYPALKDVTLRRRIYSRFNVLRQLDESKEARSVEDEIISYILRCKKKILLDSSFSKRDKMATICLIFGKKTFKFAWKIYTNYTYKK